MRSEILHITSTALKALLDLHKVESKGTAILQAIEAPYLFLHRDGRYIAGADLLSLEWLNRYLLPQGLRLTEHPLRRADALAFLSNHTPAVLLLHQDKAMVIRRMESTRIDLMSKTIACPTLLKKLPDAFAAVTLESCPPEAVDPVPLLCESLRTLAAWRRELPDILTRTVTRQDMQPLHQQYFRALMLNLPQIAHMYADTDLVLSLLELAHIYRHLFIVGEKEVLLREHLPLGMIRRCTIALQELIIDRLYELGMPDDFLEPLYRETR